MANIITDEPMVDQQKYINIVTPHSVGDTVYFMRHDQIQVGNIHRLYFSGHAEEGHISRELKYTVEYTNVVASFAGIQYYSTERNVFFKNKQDLLKALMADKKMV